MPSDRVYWDSMTFIYRLKRVPEHILILEHITKSAEQGNLLIVTSAFTMAEVAMVSDTEDDDEQERIIEDFFENDFIRLIPVDRRVSKKAREILRVFPGVKGKDAVHLATACITPGIIAMHTYDGPLLKKNGRLPGCTVPIIKPKWINNADPAQVDATDLLFSQEEEEH